MNLHLLVIAPIVTAVFILFFKELRQVRKIALLGAGFQLIISVLLLSTFCNERAAGNTAPMLFYNSVEWFSPLGIAFTTGIDGISLSMILLSAFVVLAGVLVSWKMEKMSREFFFLLTLLSAGAYGFFISLDLFTKVLN